MRHQLSQINSHLDIKKLISEIQTQGNDSYALRQLLSKIKTYCEELMRLDSELNVKASNLKFPSDSAQTLPKGGSSVDMESILRA